jgi:hypothetical protein
MSGGSWIPFEKTKDIEMKGKFYYDAGKNASEKRKSVTNAASVHGPNCGN